MLLGALTLNAPCHSRRRASNFSEAVQLIIEMLQVTSSRTPDVLEHIAMQLARIHVAELNQSSSLAVRTRAVGLESRDSECWMQDLFAGAGAGAVSLAQERTLGLTTMIMAIATHMVRKRVCLARRNGVSPLHRLKVRLHLPQSLMLRVCCRAF